MGLYLCLSFMFLIDLFWRNMFIRLKGDPHLLQSCLCVARNGFLPIVREMHPYFESLTIISTPSLQTSLMDIRHDTSFRSILEDVPFP